MLDILIVLVLILICWALGKRLLGLFGFEFELGGEEFLFATAIGLACLAYTTLALGLLGLLYTRIFYALLLILALVLFPQIKAVWLTIAFGLIKLHKIKLNAFTWCLIIILLAHLLLNLVYAFSPVTSWDAAVYHLAAPKIYLQHHHIVPITHMHESYYPFTMEMLFMLGLLLKGEVLANLLNYLMSVLSILAIYYFCRKYFSAKIGLLAAVIFYTMPIINSNAGQAVGDLGLVFYAFLAIYAFLDWRDSQGNSSLILAAVFCGICAGIKYTGLIMPFLLVLGIVSEMLMFSRPKNYTLGSAYKLWPQNYDTAGAKGFSLRGFIAYKRHLLRPMFWFITVSALVACPWYIKNYAYAANPVYPFFYKFFAGYGMANPKIMTLFYSSGIHSLRDILLFPWNLTMQLREFGIWYQSIGPLYLMFIPVLILLKSIDQKVKYLLIFCVVYMGIWLLMPIQVGRYLLICFTLLSIIAAYSIERLFTLDRMLRHIARALVVVITCANALLLLAQQSFRIPVALGLEDRQVYLSRRINSYPAIEYINSHLSDTDKVLLLDPRGYYCDKPYIRGGPEFQMLINYAALVDLKQLISQLKALGLTHILLNRELFDYFYYRVSPDLQPAYQALSVMQAELLAQGRLSLIYARNNTFVYQINYANIQ